MHIALGTGEFRGVFHFHQNDEVEVVPHVMFVSDMFFEGYVLVVERRTVKAYRRREKKQDQFHFELTKRVQVRNIHNETTNGVEKLRNHFYRHLACSELACCEQRVVKFISSPQIKHVFFKTSSFSCFSWRKSANVSMMTPKIKLRTMMMTMKKKQRS